MTTSSRLMGRLRGETGCFAVVLSALTPARAKAPPARCPEIPQRCPMMLFRCVSCDRPFKAPAEAAGRLGKCPFCCQVMQLPMTAANVQPAPVVGEPADPFVLLD